MINRFFNSQTKTVTLAAAIIGLSALLSRFLGLARDRLLAGKFGAGGELDIYFAAFRIPDFVYGLLIMGGVTAVFLPVFAEQFKKSEKEGWELANNVLNCFSILLFSLCGILAIFTPGIIRFITPGFTPEQNVLAVSLTRIMFLSPIFLGLSAVFSGILHYFDRFLAYSLAPIFYNLGIIFGILFFVPFFGLWGLAYGVVLAAFLHLVIQLPAAKISGFKYFFTFNFRYPGLMKIFKLMVPRTIGIAAYHLNLIVITAIASTLKTGSITVFNFANNLQYFPIGVVGASFALAVFPAFSRAWVNGAKEEFLNNFSFVFRQILFLTVPISVLMFLLRVQVVRLVLGIGEFGWLETSLTAASLGVFALGVFAASSVPFLARAFYSFQNTKIPMMIGVAAIVLNVVLSFLFVWLLSFDNAFQQIIAGFFKLQEIQDISVVGLPLALSLSGIFQFSLLLLFLRKKLGHIRLKEIFWSCQKMILAGILMAISTYLVRQAIADFVSTLGTFGGLLLQTALSGFFGVFIYLLSASLWHLSEIKTLKQAILRQFK